MLMFTVLDDVGVDVRTNTLLLVHVSVTDGVGVPLGVPMRMFGCIQLWRTYSISKCFLSLKTFHCHSQSMMTWALASALPSTLGSIRELRCATYDHHQYSTICAHANIMHSSYLLLNSFTCLNYNMPMLIIIFIIVLLPLLANVCVELGVALLVAVSVRTIAYSYLYSYDITNIYQHIQLYLLY